MRISEELADAVAMQNPDSSDGFIVRLIDLRHGNYPGRDANGVLPLVVTGHESMGESAWRSWVREHGLAHYGSGFVTKMLQGGVDLKEMAPTAPFGRAMRASRDRTMTREYRPLNEAMSIVAMVEKWPSLYNAMAEEMAEEEMTLREFISRVKAMPTPLEIGVGRVGTLGDLIGRGTMVLPDF